MMARQLPPPSSLSPYALEFLNSNLSSEVDLAGAAALLSKLRHQSDDLAGSLSELNTELLTHLTRHLSHSERVMSLFSSVSVQLEDLRRISSRALCDGEPSRGMGDELQAMAKEVARIETVRNYAETALKLDMLVADVEDTVSSSKTSTLRMLSSKNDSEDKCSVALRTLKLTEDLVASIVKQNPQWVRLVTAVDHRIDMALAILRPQAIADHRALLSSIGWPPSVSNLNADTGTSVDDQNPLFIMQGNLKIKYCENFSTLCGIQELQRRRKHRQLQGHSINVPLQEPLWVIEELVRPIIIASQHHFSKWIDKPEYIFALVYKITLDYVRCMDDLLQPLVDESMLSGYSCREEWISIMVSSLATHLAEAVFPEYISHLRDAGNPYSRNQARISLLNLLDLMIDFDKQFQSLAAQSGIIPSGVEYNNNLEKMSSLIVFCDQLDWLDIWAENELAETLDKLNPEMEDERNWIDIPLQVSQLSDEVENKCPLISTAVHRCLNSLIERCQALPRVSLRSRFVKLTVGPVINKLLDCLLQRCLEAEGLTALTDEASLIKVSQSVNTAHHIECVLNEFCEDIFFLEMVSDPNAYEADGSTTKSSSESSENILFGEIKKLQGFRTEWVEKFSTVILRGFDALCRDYIKNKKQWQEKSNDSLSLPRSFTEAMDYLHKKLSTIEEGLNKMDFTRVWRSVASAVDKFLFSNILLSNAKFHDGGVERLDSDLALLFGVFTAWCIRPEGFFPKISESLKLLKMEKKLLQSNSIDDERWLKGNGIKHLSSLEAQKIVKSRIFSS